MLEKRYTITAIKPDGKRVKAVDRPAVAIACIRKAMKSQDYYNIEIKEIINSESTHVLFAQGMKEHLNCSSEAALAIYRKVAKVMTAQGIEFVRKETFVDA